MNAWGFFASVIHSLAWPLVVVVLLFLFRAQVRSLSAKLSMIRYKDIQVVFDQTLERVEKAVSLETAERGVRFARPIDVAVPDNEKFNRLVDASPSAAVTSKWTDVETAIRTLAQHHGLALTDRKSTLYYTRLLRSREIIDDRIEAILRDLRTLKNLAAHPSDREILKEEAIRFGELADEVVALLRSSAD